MKLTLEEAFKELANANYTWINPIFVPIQNPMYAKEHFMVTIDDFTTITQSLNVDIYNIRKSDKIIIHCTFRKSCLI